MHDHPKVALTRLTDYSSAPLADALDATLAAAGFAPRPGAKVLVKPNLVSAMRGALACSQPEVVAAACRWLLDRDCKVTVADSPAFGTAAGVAEKCGIAQALKPLGLTVTGFTHTRPLTLSFGETVGLAADARAHDHILNLPRLKAHCQMRVTGAVKNLFGCVTGMRKALAHTRFGEQGNRFEAMILDVMDALPPVATVLDGVICMHVTGPSGGDPYRMSLLGASLSPVALDTAAHLVLHLTPADVALWRESIARGIPGAQPEDIEYPLDPPEAFDADGFVLPGNLSPVTFHPARLVKGAVKRLYAKLT